MKKILLLIPLLFSFIGLASCSESYTPTKGGVVDTLHNEVHIADYNTLVEGKFEGAKDESKTYITDDDGLKYQYSKTTDSYVCVSEYNTTIKFYFDNTQTTDALGFDCPILTVKWFMMKPLGECPEEVNSVEKVLALGAKFGFAPIQDFTNFVGFSFYSTALGFNKYDGKAGSMWDFKHDIKQQAVTCLYGIWVD